MLPARAALVGRRVVVQLTQDERPLAEPLQRLQDGKRSSPTPSVAGVQSRMFMPLPT